MEDGERLGQNILLTLLLRMKDNGLEAEIPRLASEPDFLKEMYKRFELDK